VIKAHIMYVQKIYHCEYTHFFYLHSFMRQLLEYGRVLYQVNTMKEGDWIPITVNTRRVTQPPPTENQLKQVASRLATQYITQQLVDR
jgi:hypothetical protein